MWKEHLKAENLRQKAAELRQQGFKPGCDDMTAKSAELWITINGESLLKDLNHGSYVPMPAMGFRTAKVDGSFRTLTRLTAIDMIIQRAFLDALSEDCENRFSEFSYAYRRNRGQAAALAKYCEYGTAYRFAAKVDPADCYGSMDHQVLRTALDDFFHDKTLTSQLMRFAMMPILEDGMLRERDRGIPQGLPLGPLLCNIYFHTMDKYMESQGIVFLRYADDIVLFANDRAFLSEAVKTTGDYLTEELKLSINKRKSAMDVPTGLKFLGSRFMADRDGVLVLDQNESLPTAYHAWYSRPIRNPGRDYHILSDGILRQRDFSLLLETEKGNESIPLMNTDSINVFSSVIFDSGFLRAAAGKGITVNLFDSHGHLVGRFLPNAPLRSPLTTAAQLEAYYALPERLRLAAAFVLGSIHNLRLVIRYYQKNRAEPLYVETLERVDSLERKIKACEEQDALMILEAQVRAAYYACFDRFIEGDAFRFERRSRRPPRNPVNAMLSFGNTILYSYFATEINKTALDVRVGFLHATNARRESLNLDLAELFKPLVVDRTVFRLINRKQIRPQEHFERVENGGVYLNAEGKRIFLEELNNKLHTRIKEHGRSLTYLELMTEEVRKLVRHFKTGEEYKPFKQVR